MVESKRCRVRRWFAGGFVAAALVLSACSSGGSVPVSSSRSTTSTGPTPVSSTTTTRPAVAGTGFTATWAEAPAQAPDWIFPFADAAHLTEANVEAFQYLMYRPLYSYENSTASGVPVDEAESLAEPPVFNTARTLVTIRLKPARFLDGQAVDAQSVVFWLNMMKAEGSEWGDYLPGKRYFPGDVVSYSAAGASSEVLTLRLASPVNEAWYLDNELSQITPMAEAWDVTSLRGRPGSGGCGVVGAGAMTGATTAGACRAVWFFDTDDAGRSRTPEMAGDLATYATNRLWSEGVDGPWRLSVFRATSGLAVFVPNASYSGPDIWQADRFVELSFVSAIAELRALTGGAAKAPLVGYLPLFAAPARRGPAGPNLPALSGRYRVVPVAPAELDDITGNFNSSGDGGRAGAIWSQPYVRQAMQELINQATIIMDDDRGYALPGRGPGGWIGPSVLGFDPSAAVTLLRQHGWSIRPGGTDTCRRQGTAAGDCGAGIPRGTPLSFTLEDLDTGDQSVLLTERAVVAGWSRAGIHVSIPPETFFPALRCRSGPECAWELAGPEVWDFWPDFLPTGEYLFASGAPFNDGSFEDKANDARILQTRASAASSDLQTWERSLAAAVPVLWLPTPEVVAEVRSDLGGVRFSDVGYLTPELWSLDLP